MTILWHLRKPKIRSFNPSLPIAPDGRPPNNGKDNDNYFQKVLTGKPNWRNWQVLLRICFEKLMLRLTH